MKSYRKIIEESASVGIIVDSEKFIDKLSLIKQKMLQNQNTPMDRTRYNKFKKAKKAFEDAHNLLKKAI